MPEGTLYAWNERSTYIQHLPFIENLNQQGGTRKICGTRAFLFLGNSVKTCHISPAGAIAPDSPVGHYLLEHGTERGDFNSYGSRRGNHDMMVRGTFANIRIRNKSTLVGMDMIPFQFKLGDN